LTAGDGNYFVPKTLWQPPGDSPCEAMRKAGRLRSFFESLSTNAKLRLPYEWDFHARPTQKPPPFDIVPHEEGWKFWFILAGRGFGKTRLAAEHIRHVVETGKAKRIALVAPTYNDVHATMIKGESGLMSVFPPGGEISLRLVKQDRCVYFNKGGKTISTAFIYTSEEPERIRGPQHDYAWLDEFAALNNIEEMWQLFIAGLRLGSNPRAIFTTTPRVTLLRINALENERTVVTFGKSNDNAVNLANGFMETLNNIYEDSDFAAQELGGMLRLDDSGATFKASWINESRVRGGAIKSGSTWTVPTKSGGRMALVEVTVAIDPSGSVKGSACECGIVVVGLGADNNAYVLEDLSKKASTEEWATIAVMAALKWDGCIVYETNFGGDMVKDAIRNALKERGALHVAHRGVNADTGKVQRAMKVSPFVQKGRAIFVDVMSKLEKQMTTWCPGDSTSPDRMDALVWALTAVLLKRTVRGMV